MQGSGSGDSARPGQAGLARSGVQGDLAHFLASQYVPLEVEEHVVAHEGRHVAADNHFLREGVGAEGPTRAGGSSQSIRN